MNVFKILQIACSEDKKDQSVSQQPQTGQTLSLKQVIHQEKARFKSFKMNLSTTLWFKRYPSCENNQLDV